MIPKNRKPTTAGEILLKDFIKPLGISQKDAAKALKRMKNHTFIYPDKILREKKSIGGLIKGKPKLAKKGWK